MPPILKGQLLTHMPAFGLAEQFQTLFTNSALRIERIVSHGQASPLGFWYDQPEDEWVMVLQGQASLEFAEGRHLELAQGDWVAIPAHTRHRVAATTSPTVWLAVHGGTAGPGV